jgi:poly(3-hydroxybutyrate) depolymerase
MAAEYYLETIRVVFQEFRLAEGTWDVEGERVRPQDIKHTALMTIEGELDDISGSGQTHVAHELCMGIPQDDRRSLTAEKCGHYGIFSGRRWRTIIYPQLRDFIREHAPEPKHGATKTPGNAPVESTAATGTTAAPLAAVPADKPQPETATRTTAAAGGARARRHRLRPSPRPRRRREGRTGREAGGRHAPKSVRARKAA